MLLANSKIQKNDSYSCIVRNILHAREAYLPVTYSLHWNPRIFDKTTTRVSVADRNPQNSHSVAPHLLIL